MFLKALEIQGFKSFPQKTRLTFEKPVTAIVGPNGSGKSNIADALRWVMGEQSTKTLRGGKMEDVIFGGTEKRAQVGFAEVSLILDNSEHTFALESTEVMITRRYYRSGESEYYINQQPVRLRDINELFMDTGLGREGYSIIGQGRIDEILSVRSTDRREIFEEAAGISRFRHRKEESERKLDRAEEDLLRINDKIGELELQIEPLRSQAEVARRYLLLRDELRGLEISLWTNSLDELRSAGLKLTEDCASARADLEQAQQAIDALYAAGESVSQRLHEKDLAAEEVRARIAAHESAGNEAENRAAVLRANLENNTQNMERIRQEILRQEGQNSGIQAQIEERQGRIAAIDVRRGEIAADIEGQTSAVERLAKSAGEAAVELSELLRNENENALLLASSRSRLTALAASAQDSEDRLSALLSEINDAETRLAEAQTEAAEDRKKLEQAREEAASLQNRLAGYAMRVEGRRKRAADAADKRMKLTMELNALQSRISMLQEMEKEYQGYSKAVRTVMQDAGRGILKHIHGPVANLIKTDDEYAIAVETALGGAMQHIVVDTEEDGKAAIEMLKRRDAGRTTFIPISVVHGARLQEKGLDAEEGFVGIALDLIRFDEVYREVYTNLLGRTAVVEDLDCAIRIARRHGNRFRIVTLDGQLINAGGTMTGGSVSKNAGILSRANELKNLTGQLPLLEADIRAADSALEAAQRECSAAEYEMTVTGDELRAAQDSVLRLEGLESQHTVLLNALEESRASLRTEAAHFREQAERNDREIAEIRTRISDSEAKAVTLEAAVREKTAGGEALDQERQTILNGIADLRAADASLLAERETLLRAVEELDVLRRDIAGGQTQQQSVLEELQAQNAQILLDIAVQERLISEFALQVERCRTEIESISREKQEIEAERTRRDRETQDMNRRILDLERECARLEQRRIAAEMEEKQLIDKLWDTYELSRSAAMEQRTPLTDLPAAQKRTGEIKREISGLGNPNLGAIEEFDRVNTRYTYLSEQRDDIQKAREELLSIIADITDEMKAIFMDEFQKIDVSFRETFAELFGGGQASLALEDPEDILNCGIEIHVQPPGKTLKTLTLLSGGEKAIVAIALYFAILKIRPTPFVVMDEIEAALDDANVVRFAEYLRRMADKTHFLVITHRRGTMEEADVLYGVTMQERGVSQVLSIDLEEAEKTIAK